MNQLEDLLKIIEKHVEWGTATGWTSKDFEKLSFLITEKTTVSLSPSTLKRIWGKVEYHHLPSITTLDTLALFAGFESWRNFTIKHPENEVDASAKVSILTVPIIRRKIPSIKLFLIVGAIVTVSLVGFFAFHIKTGVIAGSGDYQFSSRLLSKGIPNSVIFDYDASAANTDSIYIQQSWDPNFRTLVFKNGHQHTSVYYIPGFYKAKLVIGTEIVKEHPLLIPTDEWLGLIYNQPVPVYLESKDFMMDTLMRLPLAVIRSKNIALDPQPPFIKFINVGNFSPVSLDSFSFRCQVKSEYRGGAAVCGLSFVELVTDGGPISIPLAVKGCAAELNLMSVDKMISGKNVNLSDFGTDVSNWVTISCNSDGQKIKYFVNGKLAYQCPYPLKKFHIVGMSFSFIGTGAVKDVRLFDGHTLAYKLY